jgi:hypothetical protein
MTDIPIISRCSTSPLDVRALYVNDVPLHNIGRVEQVWDNVIGGGVLAGKPFHVPMRAGFIDIPQIPTGYDFTVGLTLYGTHHTDLPGFHEAWRDLARTVWTTTWPLTMKRVVDFGAGPEDHYCRARYVSGLSPGMAQPAVGKVALTFTNLDGYWYGSPAVDYTLSASSGAMVIDGDAITRRITMVFSGSSGPQVLTNTTTGVSVTYNGPTTPSVTLYNESFTATQSGGNVVGYVYHEGDAFWMTMAPGSNSLTLTGGGSVVISAQEAFL